MHDMWLNNQIGLKRPSIETKKKKAEEEQHVDEESDDTKLCDPMENTKLD